MSISVPVAAIPGVCTGRLELNAMIGAELGRCPAVKGAVVFMNLLGGFL